MVVSLLALASAAPPTDTSAATAEMLNSMKMEQSIELLDAGKGKKSLVHFSPQPGASVDHQMVQEQRTTVKMTMGGKPFPGAPPPQEIVTTYDMHTDIAPLLKDVIPVTVRYDDIRVAGPELMKEALETGMADLRGVGFKMLVDPTTGKVQQIDVDGNRDALQDAMQNLADTYLSRMPTFPDVPVGTGAVWKVTSDLEMAGLGLVVTQTVTVLEQTRTSISTKTAMDLALRTKTMSVPGMPAGSELTITTFDASGSGTLKTDLTTLVNTGSMDMVLDFGFELPLPEQDGVAPGAIALTTHSVNKTTFGLR